MDSINEDIRKPSASSITGGILAVGGGPTGALMGRVIEQGSGDAVAGVPVGLYVETEEGGLIPYSYTHANPGGFFRTDLPPVGNRPHDHLFPD